MAQQHQASHGIHIRFPVDHDNTTTPCDRGGITA
jgi:hypothetical protein